MILAITLIVLMDGLLTYLVIPLALVLILLKLSLVVLLVSAYLVLLDLVHLLIQVVEVRKYGLVHIQVKSILLHLVHLALLSTM